MTEGPASGETSGDVTSKRGWVTIRNHAGALRADVEARQHRLVADEPESSGGVDAGPSPYEYLLTALGTCLAITVRLYATKKSWPLDDVTVHVRMARSQGELDESGEMIVAGAQIIERQIELTGDLSAEQRARIISIAARCPVTQTLKRGISVVERANG